MTDLPTSLVDYGGFEFDQNSPVAGSRRRDKICDDEWKFQCQLFANFFHPNKVSGDSIFYCPSSKLDPSIDEKLSCKSTAFIINDIRTPKLRKEMGKVKEFFAGDEGPFPPGLVENTMKYGDDEGSNYAMGLCVLNPDGSMGKILVCSISNIPKDPRFWCGSDKLRGIVLVENDRKELESKIVADEYKPVIVLLFAVHKDHRRIGLGNFNLRLEWSNYRFVGCRRPKMILAVPSQASKGVFTFYTDNGGVVCDWFLQPEYLVDIAEGCNYVVREGGYTRSVTKNITLAKMILFRSWPVVRKEESGDSSCESKEPVRSVTPIPVTGGTTARRTMKKKNSKAAKITSNQMTAWEENEQCMREQQKAEDPGGEEDEDEEYVGRNNDEEEEELSEEERELESDEEDKVRDKKDRRRAKAKKKKSLPPVNATIATDKPDSANVEGQLKEALETIGGGSKRRRRTRSLREISAEEEDGKPKTKKRKKKKENEGEEKQSATDTPPCSFSVRYQTNERMSAIMQMKPGTRLKTTQSDEWVTRYVALGEASVECTLTPREGTKQRMVLTCSSEVMVNPGDEYELHNPNNSTMARFDYFSYKPSK